MLTRTLVGVTACFGVVGPLAAQPAAVLGRPQPVVTQIGYEEPAAPVRQAGGSVPRASVPGGQYPTTYASPPAAQPVRVKADATPPPVTAAAPAPAAAPLAFAPTASCPTGECATNTQDCGGRTACDCLCGPPGRVWIGAEWLYYRTSGDPVPALVTSGPATATRATAATLGAPGTGVLFGNRRVNDNWRSGIRVNAGMWLDDCQTFGIEANFLYLDPSHDSFVAGGTGAPGTPVVARPFVNALTGAPDTQLVSFPNVLAGTVAVDTRTSVIGGGANFVRNLCCSPCGRTDLLFGFRNLNLNDTVTVRENLTALPGSSVPAGTRFQVNDRFRTQNNFYGVPIGLAWERRAGNWFFGVRGSVAVGVVHQVVSIDGTTVITNPGAAGTAYPGGLLAQPTNSGRYTSNHFAVIPDVGARVGVQVTEHLRVFAGYNFLYWSNVARAGQQIDPRVNPNQIAPAQSLNGPSLPAYVPKTTDFWMHGVSVGAELRF